MSSKIAEIIKTILLMISTGVIILISFTWNLLIIVIFTSNCCNISKNILTHKVRAILAHKMFFMNLGSFVWTVSYTKDIDPKDITMRIVIYNINVYSREHILLFVILFTIYSNRMLLIKLII